MLSLCMIVKNEAANLPRCLGSVRSLVDEIVVLDTGSIDSTVAIARSFDAQVYHFPWNGDFSSARNESLRYVTGDWVLVLDADEVLSEAIAPTLQQAIQSPTILVINLLRHEIGATQSPYSLVSRLFRRHPDLHFTRPYHAMIDDSVVALRQRQPQWQIVDLPEIAIQHYGYQPEAIAGRSKWDHARLAMERFLAENPGEPYVCSKLGALYVQRGQLQHGIELLERGLAQGKRQTVEAPVLYELHYHLGLAYTRLQHLEQAAQQYQMALQQAVLPLLKLGAYNNLANLRRAMDDLAGAAELYGACVEIDPNFAIAHHNLGLTLKALGNLQDAIPHYQRAIALNPAYAEAHQNLGVALLKIGRVPDSLESFKRAIEFYQAKNPQEAERLRQGLSEMGFQV